MSGRNLREKQSHWTVGNIFCFQDVNQDKRQQNMGQNFVSIQALYISNLLRSLGMIEDIYRQSETG